MNAREMLDEWIARVAQVLGIPPEVPGEREMVSLDCGDDLTVHVGAFAPYEKLHVFATLAEAPHDGEAMERIERDALRINLGLAEAIPGGIGLSPDEREFVLCAWYPLCAVDVEGIDQRLENFVAVCREVRERFAELSSPPLSPFFPEEPARRDRSESNDL